MSRLPPPAGIARLAIGLLLLGAAHATTPANSADAGAIELSFIKGDTRNGAKVRLRILGDSIYYHRTQYSPDAPPRTTEQAAPLDIQRERTLKILMGELPRYPTFGSCYGKGMRYYLVDTGKGKFYRSIPERAGKCYLDEPGIFGLFEDMDDLLTPPSSTPEDLSAS
jgi:hypothetical protein